MGSAWAGFRERRAVVTLESMVIYCTKLVWDLGGWAALMMDESARSVGMSGETQVGAPHMHGEEMGR